VRQTGHARVVRGAAFLVALEQSVFRATRRCGCPGNGVGRRPPRGRKGSAVVWLGTRMSALQTLPVRIFNLEMVQRPDLTRHHAKRHEPYLPYF